MRKRIISVLKWGSPLLLAALLFSSNSALAGFGVNTNGVGWGLPVRPVAPNTSIVMQASLPATTCPLVGSTRTCELWAKTGTIDLPGASAVPIWGFTSSSGGAAQLPGPALIVNQGEQVDVVLHNVDINENVSLVFAGQPLSPDTVGVAAGGMTTYQFTASAPGTYIYQSWVDPSRQVPMGLYGALIVRPSGAPGQAYSSSTTAFDAEALLVLSEIDLDLNNNPGSFNLVNYHPEYWLINGKAYPNTEIIQVDPGQSLLLRYINAGLNHDTLALLGLHQRVIGKDGFPVSFPFDVVAETIPAGSTADMIVSVPSNAVTGTRFPLYNRQLHLLNGSSFPGGMLTFIEVSSTTPPPPPPPTPSPTPLPEGLIFTDGFESGNTSAWSAEVDGEGDLNVTGASALTGAYGLEALIDNTTSMFVQDNTPANESIYNARFYFDPNSISMASGNMHRIFSTRTGSGLDVVRVEFRYNGSYQDQACTRNDGGAYACTLFYTISDAPQAIEVDWKAATGAGSNNGSLALYIGGILKQTLSGIDNDTLRVEMARLGPLSGVDIGTIGTEYFDDFVSRRDAVIGP